MVDREYAAFTQTVYRPKVNLYLRLDSLTPEQRPVVSGEPYDGHSRHFRDARVGARGVGAVSRSPGFTSPADLEWIETSWELAGQPMPLDRYSALYRLLRTMRGYGKSVNWFDEPTPFHDGRTPRELHQVGLLEDVEERLWALASGDVS